MFIVNTSTWLPSNTATLNQGEGVKGINGRALLFAACVVIPARIIKQSNLNEENKCGGISRHKNTWRRLSPAINMMITRCHGDTTICVHTSISHVTSQESFGGIMKTTCQLLHFFS